MNEPPGKTLVVGASYVALECAGFLAKFGFETCCMVRSILLRGFDQQMADSVGSYMTKNVTFLHKCVPTKIELISDGPPKQLKVYYKNMSTGRTGEAVFNTVSGRDDLLKG
jgi:thioredoxin reductase (NADPH)